MIKKIIFVLGLVVSASSFAQAEKFSGASIGLNTGFNSETSNVNLDTTQSGELVQLGGQNTPFDINASYVLAISNNATLGLGINYDLSSNKLLVGSKNTGLNSITSTLKNHYSLNIEPGYAFNDSLLGYVKLAYHAAKLTTSSLTVNPSLTGFGYGLGARYLLDKNLYLNLEIQTVTYTTGKVSTKTFQNNSLFSAVGIGYKF